jgi:hypothetical protein
VVKATAALTTLLNRVLFRQKERPWTGSTLAVVKGSAGFTDTGGVGPCTKVRHVDLASAATALAKVRKRAKPGAKVPRGIYPCAICKGWHLTSKKGATPAWARRRLGNV